MLLFALVLSAQRVAATTCAPSVLSRIAHLEGLYFTSHKLPNDQYLVRGGAGRAGFVSASEEAEVGAKCGGRALNSYASFPGGA